MWQQETVQATAVQVHHYLIYLEQFQGESLGDLKVRDDHGNTCIDNLVIFKEYFNVAKSVLKYCIRLGISSFYSLLLQHQSQ